MGRRSDPAEVLALARSRRPTLGDGRLICIDGPAGSGKTTFAGALARLSADVRVVHMDAMYDGWGGLRTVDAQLRTLLEPLATGAPGRYRRYDWYAGRYADEVVVDPRPMLVLEGVGSWSPAFAALATLVVWVEAAPDERLARVLARDGEAVADPMRQWTRDEEAHFARTGTREQADVVVST